MNCICMYTPMADGGHARYSWEVLNALASQGRSGYRFELVTSRDLDGQFNSEKYPVHPILSPLVDSSTFSTRLGWAASRVRHYASREWQFCSWLKSHPDITAVHLQEWAWWLAPALVHRIRSLGKQVFYTVHNVKPHKYPRRIPRAVMDQSIRMACRQCDGLFVHTPLLADELAQYLGGKHPPIHVVPHGIWTVQDYARGPALAERMAWKRLLFFGNLRRNKGADRLLDAMQRLDGFSLTIAGDPCDSGHFNNDILPRVRALREKGVTVELIDRFVPDSEVEKLFATHSAIVLPYTKGFVAQSGVAFMALAYEAPIVSSEAGGLGDLLSEHRIGVAFNEQTPAALADAIRRLYQMPCAELAGEISRARQTHSWQKAASATLAGYAAAIEKERETYDCHVTTTAAH